jgi:hypothetical protein
MTDRICSFPGCGRTHHAAGLCNAHHRQRRDGRELQPVRASGRGRPLQERFDAKVDKSGECWLWTGAKTTLGYGQIWTGERTEMAHRVSLLLAGREIPDGFDVDHLCRRSSCVRPDHLEPVTHEENMHRAPFAAPEFKREQTHCPNDHEYTPENTGRRKSGARQCLTCREARRQKEYARKRELRLKEARSDRPQVPPTR